jgi:hypothetical protein
MRIIPPTFTVCPGAAPLDLRPNYVNTFLEDTGEVTAPFKHKKAVTGAAAAFLIGSYLLV